MRCSDRRRQPKRSERRSSPARPVLALLRNSQPERLQFRQFNSHTFGNVFGDSGVVLIVHGPVTLIVISRSNSTMDKSSAVEWLSSLTPKQFAEVFYAAAPKVARHLEFEGSESRLVLTLVSRESDDNGQWSAWEPRRWSVPFHGSGSTTHLFARKASTVARRHLAGTALHLPTLWRRDLRHLVSPAGPPPHPLQTSRPRRSNPRPLRRLAKRRPSSAGSRSISSSTRSWPRLVPVLERHISILLSVQARFRSVKELRSIRRSE